VTLGPGLGESRTPWPSRPSKRASLLARGKTSAEREGCAGCGVLVAVSNCWSTMTVAPARVAGRNLGRLEGARDGGGEGEWERDRAGEREIARVR
jgi:hypothetical protein